MNLEKRYQVLYKEGEIFDITIIKYKNKEDFESNKLCGEFHSLLIESEENCHPLLHKCLSPKFDHSWAYTGACDGDLLIVKVYNDNEFNVLDGNNNIFMIDKSYDKIFELFDVIEIQYSDWRHELEVRGEIIQSILKDGSWWSK